MTSSTLGLVVLVEPCEGDEDGATVYPSGTGVAADTYAGGTDVAEKIAYILSTTVVDAIDGNLAALGHVDGDGEAANFADGGGLINFILDADEGPVADATVACAAGYCPAYYRSDVEGFSFVDEAGEPTTATGSSGVAVMPGAPITTYNVSHADLAFDSRTMGSLPGKALFVSMYEVTE